MMEQPVLNPNAQIGTWMNETQDEQWAILDAEGAELLRCPTREQAEDIAARLRPLLRESAQTFHITHVEQWPDYLGLLSVPCPHARYCAWALRQLGHVTVFGFSSQDSDASFMVMARDGWRVEQPSLSIALFELLAHQGEVSRRTTVPISKSSPDLRDDDF